MKILLTHSEKLNPSKKDGTVWVKFDGLAFSGKTVSFMLRQNEVPKGAEEASLVPAEVAEILEKYKLVAVEFNDRGRVEELLVD